MKRIYDADKSKLRNSKVHGRKAGDLVLTKGRGPISIKVIDEKDHIQNSMIIVAVGVARFKGDRWWSGSKQGAYSYTTHPPCLSHGLH